MVATRAFEYAVTGVMVPGTFVIFWNFEPSVKL
jgi:hypothetical protein